MTISTTDSRISYNGNGVTTAFAFPFPYLEDADLVVNLVGTTGVATVLTLNTHYTVSSGTVSLSSAPGVGERLVINRVVPLTQETDYITGDPFPAESHERALDKLTLITQQHAEALTRTLQIPVTSDANASLIDVTAVETVAGIASQVVTVATSDAQIMVVAADITNVNVVAASIGNVNAVAGNEANINTVATNIAGVNTTATNIASILDAPNQATAAANSAAAADLSAQQAAASAASITVPFPLSSIQDIPTGTILGRSSAGTGDVEALTTLPAVNGSALTNLNGANISSGNIAAARITNALNASGSAPIYACRAWVNFNGTGTVAIRASGNVSSITDNTVGDYTVNFTTAMPDANYSAVTNSGGTSGVTSSVAGDNIVARTTTAFRFLSLAQSGAGADAATISVAIFR